jgi:hypothetical protein
MGVGWLFATRGSDTFVSQCENAGFKAHGTFVTWHSTGENSQSLLSWLELVIKTLGSMVAVIYEVL